MKPLTKSPITLRATLIGIALIPLNSYWILHLSYIWDSNRPTSLALLFNVLFTLLVLIALNTLLRRFTTNTRVYTKRTANYLRDALPSFRLRWTRYAPSVGSVDG